MVILDGADAMFPAHAYLIATEGMGSVSLFQIPRADESMHVILGSFCLQREGFSPAV